MSDLDFILEIIGGLGLAFKVVSTFFKKRNSTKEYQKAKKIKSLCKSVSVMKIEDNVYKRLEVINDETNEFLKKIKDAPNAKIKKFYIDMVQKYLGLIDVQISSLSQSNDTTDEDSLSYNTETTID